MKINFSIRAGILFLTLSGFAYCEDHSNVIESIPETNPNVEIEAQEIEKEIKRQKAEADRRAEELHRKKLDEAVEEERKRMLRMSEEERRKYEESVSAGVTKEEEDSIIESEDSFDQVDLDSESEQISDVATATDEEKIAEESPESVRLDVEDQTEVLDKNEALSEDQSVASESDVMEESGKTEEAVVMDEGESAESDAVVESAKSGEPTVGGESVADESASSNVSDIPTPAKNGSSDISDSICLYPIKKGDTLTEIAVHLYDAYARWKDIRDWNHIENPDLIRFDKNLILKEQPTRNFTCDYKLATGSELEDKEKSNRVTYRVYIKRGVQVFDNGEYERAFRVFHRVRKDIPKFLPAWFYELNALKKLNRDSEYEKVKRELLHLRPELEKLPMFAEQLPISSESERNDLSR